MHIDNSASRKNSKKIGRSLDSTLSEKQRKDLVIFHPKQERHDHSFKQMRQHTDIIYAASENKQSLRP